MNRTHLIRRIATWLALVLGLALLVPVTSGAGPAAAARGGTVVVAVTGLPGAATGRAVLKRPGFRTTLTIPGSVRAPAGRYRLLVPSVVSGGNRYLADRKRIAVRVKAGRVARPQVVFGTAVALETVVLGPEDVETVEANSLEVAPGAAPPVVGEVLTMGVTPEAPSGLIGRVTSVDGSTVVFEDATLRDAVPVASFDKTFDLTADDLRARSRWSATKNAAGVSTPISKQVTCSNGAEMEVEGSLSVSPTFDFDADWGLVRLNSASFVGRLTQDANLSVEVEGEASCDLPKAPLLNRPLRFRPITFSVGPVPVVLVPELQVYVDGSAGVEATLRSSLSQSFGVSAGLRWSRRSGLQPVGDVTRRFTFQQPTVSASAEAVARVLPEFSVLVYGLAGPSLNLNGGMRFEAEVPRPADRPWWTLSAFIGAGAALRVPALKIDKRKDDVLTRRWVVAQSEVGPEEDVDGDGWSPPGDCDDSDPSINPDATDRPEDGIDQNCDGTDAALGTGDFQATLRWDNAADLDLHVVDPNGEEIYYGSPSSSSGGELDVDANVGCGDPGAIENVFWPVDAAPSGEYLIWVDNFATCDVPSPPWRLVVRVDGEVVLDETGADTLAEPFSVTVP